MPNPKISPVSCKLLRFGEGKTGFLKGFIAWFLTDFPWDIPEVFQLVPYGPLVFCPSPGPGDRMKGAHVGRKDTEDTRRTEAKEKIKSRFTRIWNSWNSGRFWKELTGDLTGGESGRWGGKIYFPWQWSGEGKEENVLLILFQTWLKSSHEKGKQLFILGEKCNFHQTSAVMQK